jgi:glycosyltransferase involved in cell wall biosynthesis
MVSMKILIVTDAWHPQTNGVVTTLDHTIFNIYENLPHANIHLIHPNSEEVKKNIKCPFYKEIDIPIFFDKKAIYKAIQESDYIHISTESILGYYVSRICDKIGRRYNTSFHTNFHKAVPYPFSIAVQKYLKIFHKNSSCVLSASPVMDKEITKTIGKKNIRRWSRGIDQDVFYPSDIQKEPYLLYVGRVSKEKNIEDFLQMDKKYSKVVVGDGPLLPKYKEQYKDVKFVGYKYRTELADYYRSASFLVFPSKFDTFGLVLLESMACGTPVLAVDCPTNRFLINETNGFLCKDIKNFDFPENFDYNGKRENSIATASQYTWNNATNQFIQSMILSQ